jgi:predicted TIM-barrel fold metal-dependent hydrolase
VLIDSGVHPVVVRSDELRDYLVEPWRSRVMPGAGSRELLQPVTPWFVAGSEPEGGGLPGSDPALLRRVVLTEGGADYAILLPLTRGLVPDIRREVAIAAATNDWLAATWLSRDNPDGRFKGSIRVTPRSPVDAVREIERWAGHPHVVQVAVPLQAHMPYGRQEYMPIWEAAARHGLPIAIHDDGGGVGVELPPSSVGYPTHFIETFTMRPFNAVLHLASLIFEGVLERLPEVRFVFADGGYDAFWPFLWRLDKDWRGARSDTPWTQRQPSHYLADHVRFVLHRWDGPSEAADAAAILDMFDGGRLAMFGSNYPHWDFFPAREAARGLPEALRERIMGGNAAELYGLAPVAERPVAAST